MTTFIPFKSRRSPSISIRRAFIATVLVDASAPAGAIAANVPPADVPAWRELLGIYAFDELDDDTAYTIAKVLYEHCGDMATYSAAAKGVWPELVVPTVPDDMVHPGALRFYKEKGLR